MIYKRYIFTSLLFGQKKQGFTKTSLKKGIKIICFNIVLVNKPEIIDTYCTNLKSVHAQYVEE